MVTNKKSISSIMLILSIALFDNMGIGLIYPLFSCMLFDNDLNLLPSETNNEARALWLGFLIALMPMAQFFSSPIWGKLSDNKGRRNPLLASLALSAFGYLIALFSVFLNNILLLLLSRALIGFGAGNLSIVQASISDLTKEDERSKYFAFFGMALGIGFALGPLLGGVLSIWGYYIPFLFALILTGFNFIFAFSYFKETLKQTSDEMPCPKADVENKKIKWGLGFLYFKKAFYFKGLRTLFLCSFMHNFAWSYFFEFIPIYLIDSFKFSSLHIGRFYSAAGIFYALSTGFLIQPFLKRMKHEVLFPIGNALGGGAILVLGLVNSELWMWPLLFVICYFVSFVTPVGETIVAKKAPSNEQGVTFGILSSVNALAFALSPLFSSTVVGKYPSLSMSVGGSLMIITAILFCWGRIASQKQAFEKTT